MTYVKTDWVNNSSPFINESNLDKIEQGIYDAHYNAVVQSDAVGSVPLTVRGFSGQTADILRVQKSDQTSYLKVESDGDVFIGDTTAWSQAPDNYWNQGTRKLNVRSVIIGDIGDSPEIGFRRAEGSQYAGPGTAVSNGTVIAPLYWQAYDGTDWGAASARGAQIHCRTVGNQTATNHGGRLEFYTQAENDVATGHVLRMSIKDSGRVILHRSDISALHFANTTSADRITFGDEGSEDFKITRASSGIFSFNGTNGLNLQVGGTNRVQIDSTGIGFFAATPAAKPTVTGAKGSNAALGSLMTALSNLGLVTDSTSA